jgi:hypothetical protein
MLTQQHDPGRTLTREEIAVIPNPVVDAENDAVTKEKVLEANEEPPTTPCWITTPTSIEIWLPDTGMGRALRERLEKKGWGRIPPQPNN